MGIARPTYKLPIRAELQTTMAILRPMRIFLDDDSGQDLVEYGLIVGLIGLGGILAMSSLSQNLANALEKLSSALVSAT